MAFAIPGAAEDFDPMEHDYEYVQPDAEGDVEVDGATWADITELAMTALDNGTIVLRMTFASFDNALGDVMYVPIFTVDGSAYQSGVRVYWVAGEPAFVSSSGWTDNGDIIGTPQVDVDNGTIIVSIEPEEIDGLEHGSVFTNIGVLVGGLFGLPPGVAPSGIPSGVGIIDFYDTLEPSVEPLDFTYLPGSDDEDTDIRYEDIDTPRFTLDETFDEPTNRTIHYNWTTDWENLTITIEALEGASGNVTINARDGSNTTVLEAAFSGDGNETRTLNNTTTGTWQINVTYESFQGRFAMDFNETQVPDEPPSPDGEPGNETDDESELDPGEDGLIPAPAGLLVVTGLFAVLALLRKRNDRK